MVTLRLTELFHSLQGEGRESGLPTVFVRLTGCPLRCDYCDTTYAFSGGETVTLERLLERIAVWRCPRVCVTGGEPMAQKGCPELLRRLCDAGYAVSLETSGAIDLAPVDPRVCKVMDLKTPGSGELARNRYANLDLLAPDDQLKFVICDREDYDWARLQIAERGLEGRCELLFSPCAGRLAPAELARWILDDRLPVRFQVQLHKVLWGDERGH